MPHAHRSLHCPREQVLSGSIPGPAIPATPITAQRHWAHFRCSLASLRSHLLTNHIDVLSEERPECRKDNSRESRTTFKLQVDQSDPLFQTAWYQHFSISAYGLIWRETTKDAEVRGRTEEDQTDYWMWCCTHENLQERKRWVTPTNWKLFVWLPHALVNVAPSKKLCFPCQRCTAAV